MRRTITLTLCALGLLGAASPAAFANGSVGRNGPDVNDPNNRDIVYFGEINAADDVDVWVDAGDLMFSDSANALDAGQACSNVNVHTVRCSQTNLDEVRIHVFDGQNFVDVDEAVSVENTIDAGGQSDILSGGAGTESIEGSGGTDYIYGGTSGNGPAQALDGGPGDDYIAGGVGRDTLSGGGGNDQLTPYGGPDGVFGGSGIDKVHYFASPVGVNVSLDSEFNDGAPNEFDNVSEDVENIGGSTYSDHLIGSTKANALDGHGGNDVIEGGDGTDTLTGHAGDDDLFGNNDLDLLVGGDNNDELDGGSGFDFLVGDAGIDKLDGGAGDFNDALDGGTGADQLKGGPGTSDLVSYASRTQPIHAEIGAGGAGEAAESDQIADDIETVIGGSAEDELIGDDGADFLRGGGGADTLDGRGGPDGLKGQSGDDTLLSSGDGAADSDDCGADNDTVTADPEDTLLDCEQVTVVQPPGQGDGGQNGGGGQDDGGSQPVVPDGGDQPVVPTPPVVVGDLAGPTVGISKRRVKVRRSGIAAIRLTCPATAKVHCIGSLSLAKSTTKLGTKAFSILAGRSAVVKVSLRATRTTFGSSSRRRSVRVKAVVVAHGQGTMSATSSRTLRLKRAR